MVAPTFNPELMNGMWNGTCFFGCSKACEGEFKSDPQGKFAFTYSTCAGSQEITGFIETLHGGQIGVKYMSTTKISATLSAHGHTLLFTNDLSWHKEWTLSQSKAPTAPAILAVEDLKVHTALNPSQLRQTELLGRINNLAFNDAIDIGGWPTTMNINVFNPIERILLCYSDSIDGFEVVYRLYNGTTKDVSHGTMLPTSRSIRGQTILFKSTEIITAIFGKVDRNSFNAIDEIGFVIFDAVECKVRQEGPFSTRLHRNLNPVFYVPGPIIAFAGHAQNGSNHFGLNSLAFVKSFLQSTDDSPLVLLSAMNSVSLLGNPWHIYHFPGQINGLKTRDNKTKISKTVSLSLDWAAPITITTWIKYEESGVETPCIFHAESPGVDLIHYDMTASDEFRVSQSFVLKSDPIPKSTWSFIAVVFESNTVMLYVNGKEPKSVSWVVPKAKTEGKTHLTLGYSKWGGCIKDFKIFNDALGQNQIVDEFNAARFNPEQ